MRAMPTLETFGEGIVVREWWARPIEVITDEIVAAGNLETWSKSTTQSWVTVVNTGVDNSHFDTLSGDVQLVDLIDGGHFQRRVDVASSNDMGKRGIVPLDEDIHGECLIFHRSGSRGTILQYLESVISLYRYY